ncbi:MAG: orotate phosphoribosyltransferase [Chitinophagales bacterium]|nr:orotate phosphoribosyltransferase [Chitinophagales bacterium]
MSNNSSVLAEYLLQIKAIQLNVQSPFTWASGWKSPIYCDNRILLSYPEVRSFIKHELSLIIKEKFPSTNCIAGVATAGIPHATLVADLLDLPMVYVRNKPKGHGMQNTIEGRIPKDAKIVVIEDVVSTGKSSLKAVDDLREVEGVEILGMAAIYTYGFELAKERFNEKEVPLFTITNYTDLISVAVKSGYVSKDHIETLSKWRHNPEIWESK